MSRRPAGFIRGAVLAAMGSALFAACQGFRNLPESFVAEPAGWKTIELRPDLLAKYETAWQAAVDSVAMEWDIEVVDKDSGYLRTAWKITVNESRFGVRSTYANRVSLKFPSGETRDKLMVKTEAMWSDGQTETRGVDTQFNRDTLALLQGRLGRTVK